jgi:regulator of CtrA degradation
VLRHTNSDAFRTLFKEGMTLVEESAGYLDGTGRADSKALNRPAALAYATESMRLTTRLMQIASWLLLRRAVNEGELTAAQAQSERHRVRLTRQDLSCDESMLAVLPAEFVDLCARSLRLQARVMHLDRSLSELRAPPPRSGMSPFAAEFARLEAAFRPA